MDDLPPYYAARVQNQELRYDSEHAAQTQLEVLGEMAERCKAERAATVPAETPSSNVLMLKLRTLPLAPS